MLIASCTSYPARVHNLPNVIDSVLQNTVVPDKVYIVLSLQEFPNKELPNEIDSYVKAHKEVSIKWVKENWKVYKKFLPILSKHPEDLIFAFDDDIIYPNDIIESLVEEYHKHPNSPISANHIWYGELDAHCGAASLIQAKHFVGWEKYVNSDMIDKCPADDVFYTELAAINGYFYEHTEKHFPDYWTPIKDNNGYSSSVPNINRVTFEALYTLFGKRVKKVFNHEEDKPLCLLNILATPRGLSIENEFLNWATTDYNVIVVEHNGAEFEYAGLSIMQNYVVNNDIKVPVLYIHSKGAWHVRKESSAVRKMWRHEFSKKKDRYLAAVNVNKPMMATPFQGVIHSDWLNIEVPKGVTYNIPYMNGWIANSLAVRKMNIVPSKNRYIYEILVYEGIDMVGLVMHDIAGEDIPARRKFLEEIMTFK